MNKQEFLRELEALLKKVAQEEKEDILYDFEEHFRVGTENGKSEEEIAEGLGDPRVLVKDFNIDHKNEDSTASTTFTWNIKNLFKNLGNLQTYTVDEKKQHELTNIKKINVSSSTSVKVYANNEDDKLKAYLRGTVETNSGNPPSLETREENGVIFIDVLDKGNSSFGINTYSSSNIKLEVYLPNSQVEAVSITSASGSVAIEDIALKELMVEAHSGSIKADSVNIQRATYISNSGSIKLSSFLGEVKAQSASGSIKVDSAKIDQAHLSSKSGGIKLSSVFGQFIVETASGSIKVDSAELSNTQLSTYSGNISAVNISGDLMAKTKSGSINAEYARFNNNVDLETISGSIKLQLPTDATFGMKAQTVSGSIKSTFPVVTTSSSSHKVEGIVGKGENQVILRTISGSIKIFE